MRKRAELAGELERHEATVRQLQIDLANVEATIRLFSPGIDVTTIKPKPLPPPFEAGKGEMAHILFATLRTAQRACLTKELSLHVMAARHLDTTDNRLVRLIEDRVAGCLKHYRKTGLIRSIKTAGEYIRWEIAS